MLELYTYDNNKSIYICIDTIKGTSPYSEMVNERWAGSGAIDSSIRKLLNHEWSTLRKTKAFCEVKGQSNNLQPLYYIKKVGQDNIRVLLYYYDKNSIIISFCFRKKSKLEESQFFKDSEHLQVSINNWIDKHGFPNP